MGITIEPPSIGLLSVLSDLIHVNFLKPFLALYKCINYYLLLLPLLPLTKDPPLHVFFFLNLSFLFLPPDLLKY